MSLFIHASMRWLFYKHNLQWESICWRSNRLLCEINATIIEYYLKILSWKWVIVWICLIVYELFAISRIIIRSSEKIIFADWFDSANYDLFVILANYLVLKQQKKILRILDLNLKMKCRFIIQLEVHLIFRTEDEPCSLGSIFHHWAGHFCDLNPAFWGGI